MAENDLDAVVAKIHEKEPVDVRAALEWAWLSYSDCAIRDSNGIVKKLDPALAKTPCPPGGQQFLDFAESNRVGFNNLVVKVLGTDVADDDEIVITEKKAVVDLKKLLAQFKEAG